jgi:hypothetical protein
MLAQEVGLNIGLWSNKNLISAGVFGASSVREKADRYFFGQLPLTAQVCSLKAVTFNSDYILTPAFLVFYSGGMRFN